MFHSSHKSNIVDLFTILESQLLRRFMAHAIISSKGNSERFNIIDNLIINKLSTS